MENFVATIGIILAAIHICVCHDSPVIGILTQKVLNDEWVKAYGDNLISTHQVQFVQQGGARVVPIPLTEDWQYHQRMFKWINGLYIPGDEGTSSVNSQYFDLVKIYMRMAIEANERGDYFPVWGLRLGFLAMQVPIQDTNIVSKCDAQMYSTPFAPFPGLQNSRMMQGLPKRFLGHLIMNNSTTHDHHLCVSVKDFLANTNLLNFYRVISTSQDREGKLFISTIESYKYPFYAVQWHPEKSVYDWSKGPIAHSAVDVEIGSHFSRFFINEARKSSHSFPSDSMLNPHLINNIQPICFGAPRFLSFYFIRSNDIVEPDQPPMQRQQKQILQQPQTQHDGASKEDEPREQSFLVQQRFIKPQQQQQQPQEQDAGFLKEQASYLHEQPQEQQNGFVKQQESFFQEQPRKEQHQEQQQSHQKEQLGIFESAQFQHIPVHRQPYGTG